MKKYLIIGGAGFIGSHLSEALLHQGNNVVVIDNSPIKIRNSQIKRYFTSIEDAKKVWTVFKKEKPDVVYHLAGPINLRRAVADPLFLHDINFLSRTGTILDACKKSNVKKIVFASSGGAIYENAKQLPTKEDYLAHPASLYGLANLMIEKYLQTYSKMNGLDYVIARPSNVYGERQWESGVIPSFILKVLKKESPVIYGTGDQTRDFIYIDDLVKALITLAQNGQNKTYNVGSGQEVSLNEVFELIKNMLGATIEPWYKNSEVFGVERSALDIAKIKKEFGFEPKTSMREGLLKTIEYYKNAKL